MNLLRFFAFSLHVGSTATSPLFVHPKEKERNTCVYFGFSGF